MDKRLNDIGDNIEKIKDDISDIKIDLRTHIKRTDLLEESVKLLREEVKPSKDLITFLKWFAFFAGIVGSIYAFIEFAKADSAKPTRPIEQILKRIQAEVPCAIKVHSHWRSKSHNSEIGGAKHSLHVDGRAMDISAVGCMSHGALGKLANKYAAVIIYNDHVHIDERPSKVCMVRRGKGYRYCRAWEHASLESEDI